MRRFAVLLVGLGVVAVTGCQVGLSRPGFEFRVFRAPIALEPHILEQRTGALASLPLEPAGRRSFEPRLPPSQFSFPTPEVDEFSTPLPRPQVGWRPVPQAVPLPPCLVEDLVRVLRRVDQQLAPEKLQAPRKVDRPACDP